MLAFSIFYVLIQMIIFFLLKPMLNKKYPDGVPLKVAVLIVSCFFVGGLLTGWFANFCF